jgi:hypothetical protein
MYSDQHEKKQNQTTLTKLEPNEKNVDSYNLVNEYAYLMDANIQSPTLNEALEMGTIQPQETYELVSVQPEHSNAIMTSSESTEPERGQEDKKFQVQSCMIYFNTALLICLFVAFSVLVCEILLRTLFRFESNFFILF